MADENSKYAKESTEGGMESVNRVTQLPIVESTFNMASGLYNTVKVSLFYLRDC